MPKSFAVISFLLFSMISHAQVDSIWDASITIYHTSDADVVRIAALDYTTGVVQLSKGAHTIVPSIERKSNDELTGFQYGVGYYKKMTKGYWHTDIKGSSAIFYPSLSVAFDIYKSVTHDIEVSIGHRYLTYQSSQKLHLTRLRANLYRGKWMFGYRATIQNLDKVYHSLITRLWIREDDFYIEANVSNSGETIIETSFEELEFSSISYGVKLGVPISSAISGFASYNLTKVLDERSKRTLHTWAAGIKINI